MNHLSIHLRSATFVLSALLFSPPLWADEAPERGEAPRASDATREGKRLAEHLHELTQETGTEPAEGMSEAQIMKMILTRKQAERAPESVLEVLAEHDRLWPSARDALWRAFDRTTDAALKRRALRVLVRDADAASKRRVAAELAARPGLFTTRALLVLAESGSRPARTHLIENVRDADPAKIMGGATTKENLTLVLAGLHLAQHDDDSGRKALQWGRRATAPGAYPWDLASAYGLTLLGDEAAYRNARDGCVRVVARLLDDGNTKDAARVALHVLFFDRGVDGKASIVPTTITRDAEAYVEASGIDLSSAPAIRAALASK